MSRIMTRIMSRILVIDDQRDVRTMICMVLRINHFEVVEAASAAAGLKSFGASAFDAAIVDIFLEDANGFDVIATMREKVPDLPVVAISGRTLLDTVSRSAELSNVVCLQKPFRPNDLMRAIETAQRSRRPADNGASLAGGGVEIPSRSSPLNKNAPPKRGVRCA
jgi:DNA-binding response OmpR family regulator